MKMSDVGSSTFLVVFGGLMTWQAKKLSLWNDGQPGSGFFPFCLGLLLIGLSLIIFVKSVSGKPDGRETGLYWGRVIIAATGTILYPFLLESIGYLLCTFILMFILIRISVKKVWWHAPGMAGLFSLFFYILFKICLNVPLPKGIWGF